MGEEKLYTLKEIAKKCHTSVQTLRARINEGTLIANKYTREYLVTQSDYDNFFNQDTKTSNENIKNKNKAKKDDKRLKENRPEVEKKKKPKKTKASKKKKSTKKTK